MELLFKQARSFSTGDVMTLELIADIVSGRVQVWGKSEPHSRDAGTPRLSQNY